MHDGMVDLVQQLMDAKIRLMTSLSDRNKRFYGAKCGSLTRKIDDIVYKLFQLTTDEIHLVAQTMVKRDENLPEDEAVPED